MTSLWRWGSGAWLPAPAKHLALGTEPLALPLSPDSQPLGLSFVLLILHPGPASIHMDMDSAAQGLHRGSGLPAGRGPWPLHPPGQALGCTEPDSALMEGESVLPCMGLASGLDPSASVCSSSGSPLLLTTPAACLPMPLANRCMP